MVDKKHSEDDKMKDDKFILMGLDDKNSKAVAEVLGSETCKKILDFLAEVKEASEKDIAEGLGMKLNTAEYNLKKLIKAGFVIKSKNFFWSVKGRKIEVYKLAKKHIIISNKKPSLSYLKSIIPIIFVALFGLIAVLFLLNLQNQGGNGPVVIDSDGRIEFKNFDSYEELKGFLEESVEDQDEDVQYARGGFFGGISKASTGAPASVGAADIESAESDSSAQASDYSETNIQVEGVDEADIVKNDGEYIYVVSGNKIVIVDAYPADDMEIVSEINYSISIREIFVNDDKLIVFTQGSDYVAYDKEEDGPLGSAMYCEPGYKCGGGGSYVSRAKVDIYDVSDRENPELVDEISAEGSYVDSRMIGDYIYVISTKYVDNSDPVLPVYELNGIERSIPISDVYYPYYEDSSYVFTSIMAIDVDEGDFESKVYLTGGTSTVYVSQDNIFLTYQKRVNPNDYFDEMIKEVYYDIVPDSVKEDIEDVLDDGEAYYKMQREIQKIITEYSNSLKGDEKEEFDKRLMEALEDYDVDMAKRTQKTAIHKISVDKMDIDYEGAGEVPGNLLNQFSMDEHKGNFRIATTTGNVWSGTSLNHLYILDEDLEIVGSVEDLAPGERIYSARFMGDRAYMVTFKKVDPLYVIDVSKPTRPKVLGYLKIPGYSDYLHPYDENHVIGIGKETAEAAEALKESRGIDFAWYQGVKVSLFDVTDVENPKEKAKYIIGDRGTDSPALHEHKALLFDKEKGILVLPITLHEVDKSKYDSEEDIPPTAYGQFTWQGVYVLNIDEDGISLRGRVSHDDVEEFTPAKDEPVGTERTIRYYTYVKTAEDLWNMKDKDGTIIETSRYADNAIDGMSKDVNRDYNNQIRRSLYMDDYLYTISLSKIVASDLDDLDFISSVDWETTGGVFYWYG